MPGSPWPVWFYIIVSYKYFVCSSLTTLFLEITFCIRKSSQLWLNVKQTKWFPLAVLILLDGTLSFCLVLLMVHSVYVWYCWMVHSVFVWYCWMVHSVFVWFHKCERRPTMNVRPLYWHQTVLKYHLTFLYHHKMVSNSHQTILYHKTVM